MNERPESPHYPHDARIDRIERIIEALAETESARGQELAELRAELRTTTREQSREIDRLCDAVSSMLDYQRKPTNWLGLIAAVGIILGITGGYTTLVTNPIQAALMRVANTQVSIREEQAEQAVWIGRIHERSEDRGVEAANFRDDIIELRRRAAEDYKVVGEMEGRLRAAEKMLDDIDRHGSRRWVGGGGG